MFFIFVDIFQVNQIYGIKYEIIKSFVDSHLAKQIELFDLFVSINSFINYKNKQRDNFFEAENSVMGFKDLLETAGIVDPKHVEIFEEIAYDICNTKGDSQAFCIFLARSWREKALELRDQGKKI